MKYKYGNTLSLLLLVLSASFSCSKSSADITESMSQDSPSGHSTLTLNCRTASATGQDDLKLNSGYILFFSENGKLYLRHKLDASEISDGRIDIDIQSGNYRIWGIFNCNCTEVENAVAGCRSLEEFKSLSVPFHSQKPGDFTVCLNAEGSDAIVSVPENGNLSVSLRGVPSVAKITLQRISNNLTEESSPEPDSDYSFTFQEIQLNNAPAQMDLDGSTEGPRWNSTEEKTRNLENEAVLASVGRIAARGSSLSIQRSLYCFSVGQDSAPVSISVIRKKATSKEYYNIPIGSVQAGNEYIVNNLAIYKNGVADFWTPTSSEICGHLLSVCPWEYSEGTDFIQESGGGDMKCSISDKELFLGSTLHTSSVQFDRIYGQAKVSSSDETVVKAVGAGRFWTLFPIAAGTAEIRLDDGCSEDSCTVTVDESIKGFWSMRGSAEECGTGAPLHSFQGLRFNVTQWHGLLSIKTAHALSNASAPQLSAGYADFYWTGESAPYIIMNDRYGDRIFGWDGYLIQNWWNDRIPVEWISGPYGSNMMLDTSQNLRIRLQAPFPLEQLAVPVTVSFSNDIGYNCKQTAAGQYLYLTISCKAEENGVSTMDISIGGMSRKIDISYRFIEL